MVVNVLSHDLEYDLDILAMAAAAAALSLSGAPFMGPIGAVALRHWASQSQSTAGWAVKRHIKATRRQTGVICWSFSRHAR